MESVIKFILTIQLTLCLCKIELYYNLTRFASNEIVKFTIMYLRRKESLVFLQHLRLIFKLTYTLQKFVFKNDPL